MTFVNFASLVRKYTKSNSTTFIDADILLYANIFKDEISASIAKEVGEDYFGMRFERDLIAGQREYDLPAQILGRMKFLQAKLDGTNWTRLLEIDINTYAKTTDESTIRSIYADKPAQFDLWDNSIFILSGSAIINVVNGLQLWAIIYPANFANLSSTEDMSTNPDDYTHGFPREFHELLARRVSIAYKSSKDRPASLSEKEQMYEIDLVRAITSIKDSNLDRSVVPSVPYETGENY